MDFTQEAHDRIGESKIWRSAAADARHHRVVCRPLFWRQAYMTVAIMLSAADRDTAIRTLVEEATSRLRGKLPSRGRSAPGALDSATWWGATVGEVRRSPIRCLERWPGYHRIQKMAVTDPQYQAASLIVNSSWPAISQTRPAGQLTYKRTGTPAMWDKAVEGFSPCIIGAHSFWRLSPHGPCLAFLSSPLTNQVA